MKAGSVNRSSVKSDAEETLRDRLLAYVKKKYQVSPENLWLRYPDYAVFRHADNGKWFGVVMDVPESKLGLAGERDVDILNVKPGDPRLVDLLIQQPGFFRGWHMNRGNWVSILLDGTAPFAEVCRWLDESFLATASGEEKKKRRPPKEWIVPANPKYYDVERAFDEAEEILWKQGSGIKTGDTVFLYVAAPVSAILYRCRVTETDIPCDFDGEIRIRTLMRVKLRKRYPRDRFTFEALGREYGVFAVRGPRGIPKSLSEALNGKRDKSEETT